MAEPLLGSELLQLGGAQLIAATLQMAVNNQERPANGQKNG